MSFNVDWDIDKYRDEHESEDHWLLRRQFMQRWKNDYCEERLVCLARVFANVELLGCRYPIEVMQEIARLSHDVAKQYRNSRKDKLKRTFVSASDAAEDRAKGVKREGGVVIEGPGKKSAKIAFVRPGQSADADSDNDNSKNEQQNRTNENEENLQSTDTNIEAEDTKAPAVSETYDYIQEMENIQCLNVRQFNERMFHTTFGRMVLLIRPWTSRLGNIQSDNPLGIMPDIVKGQFLWSSSRIGHLIRQVMMANSGTGSSCQVCNMTLSNTYENGIFTLLLNGHLLARATGSSKMEAKNVAEILAWNRLRQGTVSVVVKEQWIAQGDSRISMSDVTGKKEEFGTPVDNSVATKMMKLMGWKGGGLGADAQGIAEPIKPHLQMVNRAGLGSQSTDIKQLRRAAQSLMQRYIASDTLDVDLVFSSEFTKDERAALHQVAQRAGLASRSYGDKDRFLVVKKKLDPFSLVRAVVEKGGNTPKYQVFLPIALGNGGRL